MNETFIAQEPISHELPIVTHWSNDKNAFEYMASDKPDYLRIGLRRFIRGRKTILYLAHQRFFCCQGLASPPGHLPVWSHWSRPHGPDERVQRITDNLLRRGIGV